MGALLDLKGEHFGRLTVLRRVDAHRGRTAWLCQCSCPTGELVVVTSHELRCGDTRSCGCIKTEQTRAMSTKHGMANTPEHGAWSGIKRRCYDIQRKDYKYYGGRGVAMCDKWLHDFKAFFLDVGPRPSALHSIDRIDNNGNYEPGNVKWSTQTEQMANQGQRKNGIPDEIVLKIIALWNSASYSCQKLSDMFNVHEESVRRFALGRLGVQRARRLAA